MNDAPDDIVKNTDKSQYSDQEINEIADWAADLTLKQLFFLKASYDSFLKMEAHSMGGNGYVH